MKTIFPVDLESKAISAASSRLLPTEASNPKTILIAVADGMGGYGDFLFALKLAEQLRKKYADSGLKIPPIYLVSQPSGKESIKKIKADIEFGVEILTPDELSLKVAAKEIEVGLVIEAPVFTYDLIDSIDVALASMQERIPLMLITEYGQHSVISREDFASQENYRKTQCKHIQYKSIIYSGFRSEAGEQGILVSESLLHPASADKLLNELDEKLRIPLLSNSDLAHYQATTALSMQYSHDLSERAIRTQTTPAHHFLKVHHEFCKTSQQNQDIVMVGKDMVSKKNALMEIKDKLIRENFTRISFINTDTRIEDVLYDDKRVGGKTYRVIYTSGMTHLSMNACIALSSPLSGATGDQSLSESLSANKIMVYECLAHKKELISDYDAAMDRIAHHDPDINNILMLLRTANTDLAYEALGHLIRDPVIQEKFQRYNQMLLEEYDLVTYVLTAAASYQGKSLIQYPTDSDPEDIFAQRRIKEALRGSNEACEGLDAVKNKPTVQTLSGDDLKKNVKQLREKEEKEVPLKPKPDLY